MAYMIRGSTQQFKFTLPRNVSDIALVKIVFWQEKYVGPTPSRKLPITKVLEQCATTDNPNELTVTLNQEETLRFTEDRMAYVQLKAIAVDDLSYTSKKEEIVVYPVYDDSVLDDDITPTPDPDGWVFFDGGIIEA